ncbi:DNA circularization N-terminal domain-containing protein [Sphingomonas sp. S-NIH.Pt15_0812]|uniref:DNA circularization N-terminal domain-containing protein n=1 Tax=Sphingomonas sp. S-NIH.Pt15_0812 TaxID=1920129 RepID=UPI000F7ED3EC|nr:DNA circularization N-terminal domain-containing protein [Sphingomonas sp. S-NIH.Pt15_0812]RSU46347.1 hypothetical protein BRX43_15920 [Sphingomonas sp. S-NIH.Pt15_0812]
MALFAQGLLPASFRGVPFAVFASEAMAGRRVALHQYPGRDEPWAEDMGREARRFRFRGFIADGDVAFAGGPIAFQRATLLAACEKAGPGLLIHPTLGALTVSLVRSAIGEDLGAGSFSTVDLEFVESGKRQFPSLLTSGRGPFTAANLVKAALAIDVVRAVAVVSRAGGTRRQATVTAATWSAAVGELGGDATALHRLAARLPGDHGRFAAGGNAGFTATRASIYDRTATIDDLVVAASTARTAIGTATAAFGTALASADLANMQGVAPAAAALIAALAAACADPADAIRLLLRLLAFVPGRPEAATPLGQAIDRMLRRATAAELVLAIGRYQPTSGDDAGAMIARCGDVLDALATAAADADEDDSYRAMRAARGAIVEDLRARAATMARLRDFVLTAALPSLALAQRLYRDSDRADQLVTQIEPVHPLFMPARFQALAA